jgi:hypothetical protein
MPKKLLIGLIMLASAASPLKADTRGFRVGYIPKNGIELMVGESKGDFRFEFGIEGQESRSGIKAQLEYQKDFEKLTTSMGVGLFHGYGPEGTYNKNPYVLLKLNSKKFKELSLYLETTGIIPLNPNFKLPKTRLTFGAEANF